MNLTNLNYAYPLLIGCEPAVAVAWIFGFSLFTLLSGTVVIKIIVFCILERKIPFYKNILAIILANIYSSIVGITLAAGFSSGLALFIFVPLTILLTEPSSQHCDIFGEKINKLFFPSGPFLITSIFVILPMIADLLFKTAQTLIFDQIGLYWIMKLTYIYIGLFIHIVFTTHLEGWVVSSVLTKQRKTFIRSVTISNVFALLFLMGFMALKTLPERMNTPGFLLLR